MQVARRNDVKIGYRGDKFLAVIGTHLITALKQAKRGFEHRVAAVGKTLAG